MICRCGCGNEATRGEWVIGHWNRGKKIVGRKRRILNPCACGCGELVKRKWVQGHHLKKEKQAPILNACACGCGGQTKGKWMTGHNSRIENVSSRPEIREKRREMFNRLWAEGKLTGGWSKGLTKETDERLKRTGEKISETIRLNVGELKRRSERFKKRWEEGTVPILSGSAHSQWKGGTSTITQRIRGSHRLYERWKRPIMERDAFRCQACGRGSDAELVIHHYAERMHEIIKRFLPDDLHELSFEEQTTVVRKVEDYHTQDSVQGITLCWECHEAVHRYEEPDVYGRRLDRDDILSLVAKPS